VLTEKAQWEIARFKQMDSSNRKRMELREGDAGWPTGDMFGQFDEELAGSPVESLFD
jgi:hypothetical protein